MGKRGPVPKGEYAGKSQVLSTRIRPDTREKLEEAARNSGRSLSQEIEHRLRRTFIDDDRIENAFGSRRNYALMRLIGAMVEASAKAMINPDDPDATDWTTDAYLFEQVYQATKLIFEAMRPPGQVQASFRTQGLGHAALLLRIIKNADAMLPLDKGTAKQHRAAIIKSDLGELVDRIDQDLMASIDNEPLVELAEGKRKSPPSHKGRRRK
jgi:hypothetical protein